MNGAFVYILQCSDGSYYVGSHRGDDVMTRVAEHEHGRDPKAYTFRRRPVRLVWSEFFPDIVAAVLLERQLKGWSRAKKEALIAGDFARLPELASRPSARSSSR